MVTESSLKKAVWYSAAILFGLAAFLPTQVMIFPLMDGWSHFPLANDNFLPYRDYFYPVPPLTIWQAQFFSLFDYQLLAYRLTLTLIMVPAFMWALMRLAHRLIRVEYAFFISIGTLSTLLVLRLEPINGWNLQSFMLFTIGIAALEGALASCSKSATGGRRASPFLWGLLAGVFFGAAALAKHTTVIVALVVLVTLVLWALVRTPRKYRQRFALSMSGLGLGLAVWALTLYIYLSQGQQFRGFIENILSGGGKGASLSKVLESSSVALSTLLLNASTMLAVSLVLLWSVKVQRPRLSANRWIGSPQLFITFAVILTFGAANFLSLGNAQSALRVFSTGILVFLFLVVLLRFVPRIFGRKGFYELVVLLVLVALPLAFLLPGTGSLVDYFAALANAMQNPISQAALGITALILVVLFIPPWRKGMYAVLAGAEDGDERRILFEGILILGVVQVPVLFVNVLSSGGFVYPIWFVSVLPILLAIAWAFLGTTEWNSVWSTSAIVILSLIPAAALAGVISSPYSWFGWREPPLTAGPRVFSELGYVKGLALAPSVAAFYDRVAEAELKAAQLSGVRNPTVFTFPYTAAAAALTGLEPYAGLPCVVLWVDVCPNASVAASLEDFKRAPADVIVWSQPDEGILSGHEGIFLGERSAIRDWVALKEESVASGEWVLVDQVNPPVDEYPASPLQVFYRVPRGDLRTDDGGVRILLSGGGWEPSVRGELKGVGAWVSEEPVSIFLVPTTSHGATGRLNVDLSPPPCFADGVEVAVVQEGVIQSSVPLRSAKLSLAFSIRPGEDFELKVVPVGVGCLVGDDPRFLHARVSDIQVISTSSTEA